MRFPLHVPLTGGTLDRAAALRSDAAALDALWSHGDARALTLWNGKAPIDLVGKPRLAWLPISRPLRDLASEAPVFLGREGESGGRFALNLSQHEDPMALGLFDAGVKFIDIRSVSADLAVKEPPIWAEAKSLLDWHAHHQMCSQCGAASVLSQGGWRRDCPSCGAKHFPRTDPVVIMLVLRRGADGVERVLIGRQNGWPPRLYSLLAGYVEPGETIEDAVRRETLEEAGVTVGAVGYLASQPWPFPSTLMIGCWGEALSDDLTPDAEELEDVRWADKSEIERALTGAHPEIDAPRRDAIARVLVEAWATGALPNSF